MRAQLPANPVEQLTDLQSACDEDPSWVCRRVFEWTESAWWAGFAEWFVARPATILVIVALAFVTNRVARRLIRRGIERWVEDPEGRTRRMGRLRSRAPNLLVATAKVNSLRSDARAQTLISVLRGVASVAIWFVAIVAILGVLEVDLTPIIAGAGIIGVALGFGAQNLVRDFISGTFIILEDQYGVGDFIDLGEAVGKVEAITLRLTRIRDVNGVVWHVPNGEIARVANQSQEWARALLDVEVAYETDLDHAQRVIGRTAEELSADPEAQYDILESPEVWGVQSFNADGIAIRVVLKTRPGSQWAVLRQLRRRLKEAFDEEGIEIPFPQRTLWVREVPGEASTGLPGPAPPPTPPPASPESADPGGR